MPLLAQMRNESHVVSFRNGAAHFSDFLAWARVSFDHNLTETHTTSIPDHRRTEPSPTLRTTQKYCCGLLPANCHARCPSCAPHRRSAEWAREARRPERHPLPGLPSAPSPSRLLGKAMHTPRRPLRSSLPGTPHPWRAFV